MKDLAAASERPHRTVLRNALFLVAGQALALPLGLFLNALAARWLGPADFGRLYLATTYVTMGMVFVDWGQGLAVTGAIARRRRLAGVWITQGLALRLLIAPAVFGVLLAMTRFWGDDGVPSLTLALAMLLALAGSIAGALQDALRAIERADLAVRGSLVGPLLSLALVPAALLTGGGLTLYLCAQTVCALAGSLLLRRLVWQQGLQARRLDWRALRLLFVRGTPYLTFALVLVLQPTVDAYLLSHLAPVEVVGWNAVARKLLGVVIYPASALVGALYPTLTRLHAQAPGQLGPTVSASLRSALLVGVAAGMGCLLFPGLGVSIFGGPSYAPVLDNLRVMSAFVILVYISMPLSSALMVTGRRTLWSLIQLGCVVLSALLDPLLIPWAQARYGNGGLGVAIVNVVSEVVMVGAALAILPRGTLQGSWLRPIGLCLCGALGMAWIAHIGRDVNDLWIAPCALGVYLGVMWVGGEVRLVRSLVRQSRA